MLISSPHQQHQSVVNAASWSSLFSLPSASMTVNAASTNVEEASWQLHEESAVGVEVPGRRGRARCPGSS